MASIYSSNTRRASSLQGRFLHKYLFLPILDNSILLNIGLQQGIITPTLFTMLVLMAIITTLMASPIFELVYGRYRTKTPSGEQAVPVELTLATKEGV